MLSFVEFNRIFIPHLECFVIIDAINSIDDILLKLILIKSKCKQDVISYLSRLQINKTQTQFCIKDVLVKYNLQKKIVKLLPTQLFLC